MLSILRKDVFVLGLTDAVMFGATFLCVLLQKAVYHRWINWNSWGWIIQHVLPPVVVWGLIVDLAGRVSRRSRRVGFFP